MFGFVNANREILSEESKKIYSSYYCGLCHAIKKRYGQISRVTLNYDLTFLAIFLSSVYDDEQKSQISSCGPHPFKKHEYFQSEILDYCADMNIMLFYYKLLDDKNDDKNPFSSLGADFLKKKTSKIARIYPEKVKKTRECLSSLSDIEKKNILIPDVPAKVFGEIMGELFCFKNDDKKEKLFEFGCALGEFIYIADASIDLKKDLKHKNYNPLVLTKREDFSAILNMLLGECVRIYNEMSIDKNKEIIENILYSGIWTKINLYNLRGKRGTKKTDE